MWTRVEERIVELETEITKRLFEEKKKEGFFNKRCGIREVLDFGKHNGKTFM